MRMVPPANPEAAIKAKRIEILAKAREAKKANQVKKKDDLQELKEIKEKPVKPKKEKKDKQTIVNNYYYGNEATPTPTNSPSDKKSKPAKPAKEKKQRPPPVDTPKKILFV